LDKHEITSVMYATGVPRDKIGLTAYWQIDDDSNTIKDSIGTNNGTLQGTATWISGRDVLGQAGSTSLIDLLVKQKLIAALTPQDFYGTQKLAAFFQTPPALMAGTQAVALASKDQPLLHINRLLIDLSAGDSVPDKVMQLFAVLAQDLYLARAL